MLCEPPGGVCCLDAFLIWGFMKKIFVNILPGLMGIKCKAQFSVSGRLLCSFLEDEVLMKCQGNGPLHHIAMGSHLSFSTYEKAPHGVSSTSLSLGFPKCNMLRISPPSCKDQMREGV